MRLQVVSSETPGPGIHRILEHLRLISFTPLQIGRLTTQSHICKLNLGIVCVQKYEVRSMLAREPIAERLI